MKPILGLLLLTIALQPIILINAQGPPPTPVPTPRPLPPPVPTVPPTPAPPPTPMKPPTAVRPVALQVDQGNPDVKVWVNTASGVYHCPGTRWYGNTKQGDYMSQAEAQKKGYRPAYGKVCR